MRRFDLLNSKRKKQIIQLMKEAECKSVWKGLGKPGGAAGTSLVERLPPNKGAQRPLVSSAGTAAWLLFEPRSPRDRDVSLGLGKPRWGGTKPRTPHRHSGLQINKLQRQILTFATAAHFRSYDDVSARTFIKLLSSPSTQPSLGNNKEMSEVI